MLKLLYPGSVYTLPRVGPLVLMLGLSGCRLVESFIDKLAVLSDQIAGQGTVLGVEPPEDESAASVLAMTEFASGSKATIFFADGAAGDAAPLSEEETIFYSPSSGRLSMPLISDGKYEVTELEGLIYMPAEEAIIQAEDDEAERSLSVNLPAPADVEVPATLAPNEGFSVDVSGQDFTGLLIVVYGGTDGASTYSTLPVSAAEVYEFSQADEELTGAEVPGSAFPSEGIFVVGIAGTERADPESFEEVSPTFSTLIAGDLTFHTVCTYSDPVLCSTPEDGSGDTGS